MIEREGRCSFLFFVAFSRSIICMGAILNLLLFSFHLKAQSDATVQFECKTYPFIHPERNEIIGARSLDSFFHKLWLQKTKQQSRINVLQIGDSHIQADFISAQVRTDIQNDFGNAGRGLLVPLKVAGTNEPFNYRITSSVVCDSKRCVFPDAPLPIGIGGVTIHTGNDSLALHLKTFNSASHSYEFDKITLFYEKDSAAFNFRVTDSMGNHLGDLKNNSSAPFPFISTLQFSPATNNIFLTAEKSSPAQNNALIYGINLENDSSGVIYHAVGVNGAEAFEYARASHFAEQTPALHPDLIIISLGTNEAQHKPFDNELTLNRLDSLVKRLRAVNPNTPIIFTSPTDSYYKKKYFNPGVAAMHAILVDYAKANNMAIWDLYSIAGGYKSCYEWKKYGLMRSDGIHFTRLGYEFQGNLFYEALIKAYNKYVTGNRLP